MEQAEEAGVLHIRNFTGGGVAAGRVTQCVIPQREEDEFLHGKIGVVVVNRISSAA